MGTAGDWRAFVASRLHCPVPPPPHPTYDLTEVIQRALAEDAGDVGDATTNATIAAGTTAEAELLCKEEGVVAGLGVADLVVLAVDPALAITWLVHDGEAVTKGQVIGRMAGSAASLLVAERVVLNFMQRMSGIASLTARMVAEIRAGGHGAVLLDTRKTVPGLRLLDKWAVLLGGGSNHRIGLYDMMMIKDNHIAAAGGMGPAVRRAQEYIAAQALAGRMPIEVEVRTAEEVEEVKGLLQAPNRSSITRVMLDNMAKRDAAAPEGLDVSALQRAVEQLGDIVDTEASGNVTLQTVRRIASTGVKYISCGSLTHSVKALDISMNIVTH